MARELTVKQRKWADLRLKTGNGTEAARRVYKPKNDLTASVIASENLGKPNVRAYLEEKASRASARMYELMEQDNHLPTAYNAASDILDRAGYKPVEKTLNMNLNEEVPSDKIRELASGLLAQQTKWKATQQKK